MNVKALTVYFELVLVPPQSHSDYILAEYGPEDKFWDAIDFIVSSGVELPYIRYPGPT